jgi:hypothetical protein
VLFIPGDYLVTTSRPLSTTVLRLNQSPNPTQTNGYYADTLSGCQSFHVCGFSSSVFGSIKYTSLCPNGTIFNQELFTCDWWYRVDCGLAESFYFLNDNIQAFADVSNEQAEKPFLIPFEQQEQQQQQRRPIVRKNGGSFTGSRSSSSSSSSSSGLVTSRGVSQVVRPAGLYKGGLKQFPNFDIVDPKRSSREESGQQLRKIFLDGDAYGAKQRDGRNQQHLTWGRRGKRKGKAEDEGEDEKEDKEEDEEEEEEREDKEEKVRGVGGSSISLGKGQVWDRHNIHFID